MQSPQLPRIDRGAVSRALISLVADLAWAARQRKGAPLIQPTIDEAMALLPKVERGDREAARRAMELVTAASVRA
jgi:DNA-binding GntR family transcriptional regulator